MIRTVLCFLALLYVVAASWYLPEWINHARAVAGVSRVAP